MEIQIKISKEQLSVLGATQHEISLEINSLVRKHIEELCIENNHFIRSPPNKRRCFFLNNLK